MNLYIYCEGQTEESFIRHVLQKRFAGNNIFVTPIIATTKLSTLTGALLQKPPRK